MIQVRNQASLKGNSFFVTMAIRSMISRGYVLHIVPRGQERDNKNKDPGIQGVAMGGGSGAFVVQPFPEDSGAVQENVCELLGTSSSGGRRHLFPEGWSYLCKF